MCDQRVDDALGAGDAKPAGARQIRTRQLAGTTDQIQQRALAGTGGLAVAAAAVMRTNGRVGEEGRRRRKTWKAKEPVVSHKLKLSRLI
ncbi:hypothetical protein FHT16_001875 [Xanthomonas arboricola]